MKLQCTVSAYFSSKPCRQENIRQCYRLKIRPMLNHFQQCSRSVTFRYEFGSSDPYHLITDPDPVTDSSLFYGGFPDANIK
jgi:hypothetical protein